jgi:hypothetical protein
MRSVTLAGRLTIIGGGVMGGVGWRGTGYKFAPWVGRVLAQLALQRGLRPRTADDAAADHGYPRGGGLREALGREVPAGKYSPSMDLHPMFRADISAKNAAFLHTWTA